jgi:hypothetical protein
MRSGEPGSHQLLASDLGVESGQLRHRQLVRQIRRRRNGHGALRRWCRVDGCGGGHSSRRIDLDDGYDTVWDSRNLGYNGPKFSWLPMPDQYTLKQLNTIEYKKPGRGPLMIELPLVSSHTRWAPIPTYLPDWSQVGDGSIYAPMVADGKKPKALWAEPRKVRAEYGKSIVYTLTSLIDWMKLYGDGTLVMVFLGDHQPNADRGRR